MPEGISVIVDDEGYANITFLDRRLRGPALGKLIAIGGAETVEKSTENGYPVYRVPEGNARAAGLLHSRRLVKAEPPAEAVHVSSDGTETPLVPDADGLVTLVSDGEPPAPPAEPQGDPNEPPAGTDTTPAPSVQEPKYPEGEPTADWKLTELKAYAVDKGLDAQELHTKVKVLELINDK